jgi:hypothetical protein
MYSKVRSGASNLNCGMARFVAEVASPFGSADGNCGEKEQARETILK